MESASSGTEPSGPRVPIDVTLSNDFLTNSLSVLKGTNLRLRVWGLSVHIDSLEMSRGISGEYPNALSASLLNGLYAPAAIGGDGSGCAKRAGSHSCSRLSMP
jgi:hypothetical protein